MLNFLNDFLVAAGSIALTVALIWVATNFMAVRFELSAGHATVERHEYPRPASDACGLAKRRE